jgi:imidazolonepropionase-like amidohydrolase
LCSVGFREAVDLGIDNLEHGLLTDTEFWPGKKPDECPTVGDADMYKGVDIDGADVRRTIQAMVSHKVSMTSTLDVMEISAPRRFALDPRVINVLHPEAARVVSAWHADAQSKDDSAQQQNLKKAMQFERAFVKAGGLLAAGSDPCCRTAVAGYGDQRNFELLVEAGFTAEQAIAIMTANGAKVLGIADRVGLLAAGKQADLVVLKGDIVRNPVDIRNVTTVFRKGLGFDPSKLTESIKGVVGAR